MSLVYTPGLRVTLVLTPTWWAAKRSPAAIASVVAAVLEAAPRNLHRLCVSEEGLLCEVDVPDGEVASSLEAERKRLLAAVDRAWDHRAHGAPQAEGGGDRTAKEASA